VRVAITRLTAAGLIEPSGRGAYRLGERAEALAREVSSWRDAERKVRGWDGGWVAVHTGAAPAGDRGSTKLRGRALSMLGLRDLHRGLAVRPDNLEGGVEGVRVRLADLGLEAPVFLATELDRDADSRARKLWDGRALDASYRRGREKLERWLVRSDGRDREIAAREAFLLGHAAIRQIVYDPLLPAPLVDIEERRAFVDAASAFDRAGREIWLELFGLALRASSPSATLGADWAHRDTAH
jgi:phenylacetic acid degradation operon negative regulatory protein